MERGKGVEAVKQVIVSVIKLIALTVTLFTTDFKPIALMCILNCFYDNFFYFISVKRADNGHMVLRWSALLAVHPPGGTLTRPQNQKALTYGELG